MPYVLRDDNGAIIGVTDVAVVEGAEWVAETDPEMVAYVRREAGNLEVVKAALHQSDVEMVRVIEDLIVLMIEKGVIRYTDLPEAARQKINLRNSIRQSLGPSDELMVDENDIF